MGTVLFPTQIIPRGHIDNHRGKVTPKPEFPNLSFSAPKMRSSAISVDGTMATATTTKTEMSMATATDRIVGGGTHAAGVRRTMSGSTEGGWGEGMTTNAVRLPRRTRSARRPKKMFSTTTATARGSASGVSLTTTARRTTRTTTTLGRGALPPLMTGTTAETAKRTASTTTTTEATTGETST